MASDVASGALTVILDKVSFVNKVPLLVKATSDDERPTAGYMYADINKITFETGGHCQTLLDYLEDRLRKDSYHVKLKVLRILKYLVENGHPDFRQGLRRRSSGILEATKYSGPPDPLHGNAPYLLVRKTAKELSQILFDVNEDDSKVTSPQSVIMKSTGGMGVGSSGGGRMEGFGNTPQKPNRTLGDSIMSGIKDFAERVVDPVPLQHFNTGFDQRFDRYQPVQIPSSDEPLRQSHVQGVSTAKQKNIQTTRKASKGHTPGKAGGGWDDGDEEEDVVPSRYSNTSSSNQASSKSPASATSHASRSHESQGSNSSSKSMKSHGSSDSSEKTETKIEQWKAEEKLVNDFIHGDTNPLPNRHQTSAFIKSCSSLNCEMVLRFLTMRLTPSIPNTQLMRALMLVEAFVRTDLMTMDCLATLTSRSLITVYRNASGQAQSKSRKIIRQLEKLCKCPELFADMPKPHVIKQPEQCDSMSSVNDEKPDLLQGDERGTSPEWTNLKIPFANQSDVKEVGINNLTGLSDTNVEKSNKTLDLGNSSPIKPSAFSFLYEKS